MGKLIKLKKIQLVGLILSGIAFTVSYLWSKLINIYDIGVALGFVIGVSELTFLLIGFNISKKKGKKEVKN